MSGEWFWAAALLALGSSASGDVLPALIQPAPRARLALPPHDLSRSPKLLSQTGAFADVRSLRPVAGLVSYELNVPFWSDGADKQRWIALPPGEPPPKIHFAATGEWRFPAGTVFVKHFEIERAGGQGRRRLETRFLLVDSTGGVSGVTYKWRADESDAELLVTNLLERVGTPGSGNGAGQNWYYPTREDCRACHTALNGGVLGPKTRQLNRNIDLPGRGPTNQLVHWSELGLLEDLPSDLHNLPWLASIDATGRDIEERARSWLDANCAHCHRPGGTVAGFDARFDTPLAQQNLIDGSVLIDEGLDHARIIAPHDEWRSIALLRVDTLEAYKMPPLARETIDFRGVELLREWIRTLAGPPVLAPPVISPKGGEFSRPVRVTLRHSDPNAILRYTTDGSVPGKTSDAYTGPVELPLPFTFRARAFRDGWNKSITVQETFVSGGGSER